MNKVFENLMHLTQCSLSKTLFELLQPIFTLVNSVKRTIVNILPSISINLKKIIFIGFIFLTNTLNAQAPTFGNTSTINICVNGSYYLNPSTTDGTFSTLSSTIATVNSSGYVTGVSEGTTTVSLEVTGGGTVTATVTVSASASLVSASASLAITDPLAEASYKFNNNPQGPVGGLNNYVGYNGFSYSSQARPIKPGYFRASKQLGSASGCPFEYDIFRCTTCGTVPEYATRPQGTITGNTIQFGDGSLTYTSTNSTPDGPFTIVYLPSGGSNVSIPNIISGVPFSIGTFTSTTSYNLISVTDQTTNASTDFSGITTSISVVPPPTASLTGTQSICAGVTANLSLRTTGTGSITVTLSNGLVVSTISGTTSISVTPTISTTYTISSVTDISGAGIVTGSSSAIVSVNPLTAISVQPITTVTLVEPATVTLSVTATNATAYQWYKDGVAISTASTYTTANTTAGAGTYYVTVSGTCNTVTSVNAIVNVFPIPQGTLSGSSVNQGETGRLTYTSSTSPVGGPFTIVYLPSGGTNVTVTNVTSGVAFNVASGTPSTTTTYSLVSITQETSTISRTSGFAIPSTATINIINTPTVASTITSTITSSTAILGGVLSSTGGATTTIGIIYSTDINFTTSSTVTITSNASVGNVTTTITGLTQLTTYYAKAYATNTAGTTYGPTISFTTPVAPIAAGSSYQGGIVFYILQPEDPGYDADVQHGLIAAPVDQSSGMSWNQAPNVITGATETAIGTGKSNTDKIIIKHPTNSAAAVARAYNGGGYSDWYLPSRDELRRMFLNIGVGDAPPRLPSDPMYNLGGFSHINNTAYFSSSESVGSGVNNVYYTFFLNGTTYDTGDDSKKTTLNKVRAIRSF
jgi:hypothetical protein